VTAGAGADQVRAWSAPVGPSAALLIQNCQRSDCRGVTERRFAAATQNYIRSKMPKFRGKNSVDQHINRKPRIEPRSRWPRGSPCAQPHALVAGKPGARFHVEVEHVDGRPALPIVRLRRAAYCTTTSQRRPCSVRVCAALVIAGSFRD
jgi:hypothetical protein